mmetsp:Transcript_27427/g.62158  ORF Transcript_27427/g.62158 Transcript_27427/m.62158 type:complete len:337 (-) Transcript_27427:405-1415(-)
MRRTTMSQSCWTAVVFSDCRRRYEDAKERGSGVNYNSQRLCWCPNEDLSEELMAVGVRDSNLLFSFGHNLGWNVLDEDAMYVFSLSSLCNDGIVGDADGLISWIEFGDTDGGRNRRRAASEIEHDVEGSEENSSQHYRRLVRRFHRPGHRHHTGTDVGSPCLVQECVVLDFQILSSNFKSLVDAVDGDEHLGPLLVVVLVQRVRRLDDVAVLRVGRQHDAGRAGVEQGRNVPALAAGREHQQLQCAVEVVSDPDGVDRQRVRLGADRRSSPHLPNRAPLHVPSQLQLSCRLGRHECELGRETSSIAIHRIPSSEAEQGWAGQRLSVDVVLLLIPRS